MNAADTHPGPDLLSDYALGRLVNGEFVAVAEHVDRCDECQETLSHISLPDDTLIRGLAGEAPDAPFDDEPECAAALDAIARLEGHALGLASTQGLGATAANDGDREPLASIRDYELLGPLGRGGMGMVYRARHTRLDRLVAVKVLPAERMRQPQAVARFHREMKALGNLDHPHVVRAYDAGEADGKHFLVMELIEGVDLATLAEREGPLDPASACELVRQAALGLDYAHGNGLVHRDVKPSNLMLDRSGVVKVLDLGLARLLGESASEGGAKPQAAGGSEFQVLDAELTGADQAMGTPDYMAPEQCTHSHAVDGRTDVYSLGATLYRLLAGRAPYAGPRYDTVAKKIAGLTSDPAPPLGEQRRDVPAGLVTLVHRMLAKDAAERVATPGDVAALLAPYCRGHHVDRLAGGAAKPQMAGGGGRRWVRWAVAAAAAGALAALAPVLARVMTPYGELTVEVADEIRDDVRIRVERGSEVHILGEKPGEGWSIALADGVWDIELEGSTNQYTIDADTVTMNRGDREVVRVTLRPSANREGVESPPTTETASRRSTPQPGQWRLHLPAGHQRMVGIVAAGEQRVIMHLGDSLGGQYVWDGTRLVVERPNDKRYVGLAWTWDGEQLVLVDEPSSHPAGPSYVGARLTWIDPNPPTVQPREYLGETEDRRLALIAARNPRTGHVYQRGNVPMSWHEAKAYCEERGGHLATVADAEENEFLYQNFARDQACWLGATNDDRTRAWRWVNGEPMNYTNWFRDEPEYREGDSGDEHYAAFGNRVSNRGGGINFHFDGYWCSIMQAGQHQRLAFVLPLCEWDEAPADAALGVDAENNAIQADFEPIEQFEVSSGWPVAKVDGFFHGTADGDAWKFDVEAPGGRITLFTRQRRFAGKAIVKFSAEIRSENLQGRAFLELQAMRVNLQTTPQSRGLEPIDRYASADAGPEAVPQSRSIPHTLSDQDWVRVEAPLLTPDKMRESELHLNFVVEGTGVVWLRNVQLEVRPLNSNGTNSNSTSPESIDAAPPR